jgi:hypothetical protein
VKTGPRKIVLGTLIGAAIGAVILFFFGDGFAMAFYLAAEGLILGGLVGATIGLLVFLLSVVTRKST